MTPERLAEIKAACLGEKGRDDASGPVEYFAWDDALELIAEVERLRALNESLAARVAAQSEILSRRAEANP